MGSELPVENVQLQGCLPSRHAYTSALAPSQRNSVHSAMSSKCSVDESRLDIGQLDHTERGNEREVEGVLGWLGNDTSSHVEMVTSEEKTSGSVEHQPRWGARVEYAGESIEHEASPFKTKGGITLTNIHQHSPNIPQPFPTIYYSTILGAIVARPSSSLNKFRVALQYKSLGRPLVVMATQAILTNTSALAKRFPINRALIRMATLNRVVTLGLVGST